MADPNQMIETPQGPRSLAYLIHCATLHDELVKNLKATTFIVESVAHLQKKEGELLPVAEAARAIIERAESLNPAQGELAI